MKKYNKMFARPTPGGECVFVIAKNRKHMEKILKKTDVIFEADEFEFWGKFTDVAKEWEVNLKGLVERSGLCYFAAYGKRYNCLKKDRKNI